jgi:hypothetical protein
MLYDAWGRHLEAIKDYQSADKVYQKGVDHRAQPEDKMKQCQVQYQARMYQYVHFVAIIRQQLTLVPTQSPYGKGQKKGRW